MNLWQWLKPDPTKNPLFLINLKLTRILATMATSAEQAATENKLADQLNKALAEILSAIQALQAAQQAGSTTPDEDAATARLVTVAQALDDVIPDAPAPAPAPEVTPEVPPAS